MTDAYNQNLFPVEIENALTSSPLIREAAVVAVPDGQYGEVVGAWILLEETQDSNGVKMSREDVKSQVSKQMNPQVGLCPQFSRFLSLRSYRMHLRTYGFWATPVTLAPKICYQRLLVVRS